MLSHNEAQELHRLIGSMLEAANGAGNYDLLSGYEDELERARELAAVLVADTMPSPVSYDPCVTGRIEIDGQVSEFLLPIGNDSVKYSQWGADNTVLWPRAELLDSLAEALNEWALDNLNTDDENDDE